MQLELMIGKVVNFRVYPSGILGDSFTGVKILSVMDYTTANETRLINTAAMHSQVYGTIPSENLVEDDDTSYKYVKFLDSTGKPGVLGIPWIIDSSIEETGEGTITFKWEGKNINDVEEIKKICQSNGHTPNFTDFSN